MAAGSATTARSFEYWMHNYRRTWRGTVLSSALNPLLYLAALGVGLGTLVDQGDSARLGGVDYLAFIAPGLLAASAMQVATIEATYPVFGSIKWTKTYYAMLATPLRVTDVMFGHMLWIGFRIATSCAVYMVIMGLFGVFASPWAVLALPAAILTGVAFAAPVAAFAVTLERDHAFASLFRFAVIPMFLFSGTFFPVDQLPDPVEPVAYLTPLWHGVDLARDLTLGEVPIWPSLAHVGYLALWVAGGLMAASVTYRRRLRV